MTKITLVLHRWLGLLAGALVLVAATTALALNHQDLWKRSGQSGAAARSPYQKYVLSIGVDPADPARVLVGTSDGLFRSRDGGKTWEEAILPVPAEGVSAIAFDAGRPGVTYVAIRKAGVFRSDDHGDVWEEVALPFLPPEGTEIAGLTLGPGGTLAVLTPAGIFRQTQAGGAWQREAPTTGKARTGGDRLLQVVYDLHDGRFWGAYGVMLTDAVAGALIVLVLSGYAMFFARLVRRRQATRRPVAMLAASTPRSASETLAAIDSGVR